MTEPTSGGRPPAAGSGPDGVPAGELLASVQRLTGVGVWWYDANAGEVWWSDQAKRIHGFDAREHPSFERLVRQYAPADRSTVRDLVAAAVEDGEPFRVDVGLTGEGTTERSVRLRCEPRRVEGTTVALYGTVRDVTDARRREQRIEVLRRTGQRLKRANSRQAVAEVVADASKNILGLVNSTVRLIDGEGETLRTVVATEECVARAGERPDYPIDEENPATRVYRTGEPEVYADIEASNDDRDRGELVSGIYVPIGDHGVLSAGDVVPEAFDDRDVEAASLLGQLAADALTRIGWAKRSRAV